MIVREKFSALFVIKNGRKVNLLLGTDFLKPAKLTIIPPVSRFDPQTLQKIPQNLTPLAQFVANQWGDRTESERRLNLPTPRTNRASTG